MKPTLSPLALALLAAFSTAIHAQEAADTPLRQLGTVTISGTRPTSLPTQIPTTIEGITREEIERTVNATDAEDALKYLPSLLVRKRYIGDYNHAVLSTVALPAPATAPARRCMRTACCCRTTSATGPPTRRAGRMVTPGGDRACGRDCTGHSPRPIGGNSAGAVVDFVTRMPEQVRGPCQGHRLTVQPFRLYNTDDHLQCDTRKACRARRPQWRLVLVGINFNHTDSRRSATDVSDATGQCRHGRHGRHARDWRSRWTVDRSNNPWYLLGTATEYRTLQEHVQGRGWPMTSRRRLRASYTLRNLWSNDVDEGRPASYLRDAGGNPVYSGTVNIGGRSFHADRRRTTICRTRSSVT